MPRQWRDKTRNTLTNIKAGCYRIDRLAVTLPFPERANEIMAFNGRWIKEFQRHSLKLDHGGYIQENRRGRTSHEYFPGMVVGKQASVSNRARSGACIWPGVETIVYALTVKVMAAVRCRPKPSIFR